MKPTIKLYDTNFIHHGEKNSISSFPGFTFEPSLVEIIRNPNHKSEVAIFTDNELDKVLIDSSPNKYALLLEPRALVPSVYENIIKLEEHFKYIFTHDSQLLARNGKYVPYLFGGLWADPKKIDEYKQVKRKRKICIIASVKRQLQGQIYRHQVISVLSKKYQIDVFGNGYRYVENIGDVLCNYEYNIVIENIKDGWWITEKPITPLFCGSKVLYWGSHFIDSFFKEDGLVQSFDNMVELEQLINKCLESDRQDIHHVTELILKEKMNCTEDWIWKNYFELNNGIF